MDYKLIADSSCELTDELKQYFDAEIIPLFMTVDDETFVDDDNLDIDNFIKVMNQDKVKTKSSCPAPTAYEEKCVTDKSNFIITLSSKLSGSFQSAKMAEEIAIENGKEVYVFDSKSASAGEILIAIKIKEFIEKNLHTDEIIKQTELFIKNMKTFFVLENLDIFIRSGRVNKILGRLATVMNIRPILGSDGEGNVAFYSKARGGKQAIEKLCETIGEHCPESQDKTLVITHCQNPDGADYLKNLVSKKYSFKDILTVKTRGLSSMYANSGGIIIAF